MKSILIRAGHHVASPAQGLIRNHVEIASPHCTKTSGRSTKGRLDFLDLGRAHFPRLNLIAELLFSELMIASKQNQDRLAVDDVDEGLDLSSGFGTPVQLGKRLNRSNAGRRKFFGRVEPIAVFDFG